MMELEGTMIRFPLRIMLLVFGLALFVTAATVAVSRQGRQHGPPWLVFFESRGMGQLVIVRMLPGEGRIYDITSGVEPTGSPDGQWIAYPSQTGLNRVRLNGRGVEQVLAPGQMRSLQYPAWSPDGRWIAFTRYDDHLLAAVCLVPVAGGAFHCLTPDFWYAARPAWSPDSQWIAFVGQRAAGELDVYVMRSDGSDVRQLTNTPGTSELELAWSPDGRWLAYQAETDIHLMVLVDDEGNLVGDGQYPPAHYVTVGEYPSWSPDGAWITYSARIGNSYIDVYRIRPDGRDRQQLTDTAVNKFYPFWMAPAGFRFHPVLLVAAGGLCLLAGTGLRPWRRQPTGLPDAFDGT
jgi:dipeptidyl aminopeptidase/acylaminoacyl peptidase